MAVEIIRSLTFADLNRPNHGRFTPRHMVDRGDNVHHDRRGRPNMLLIR
jgi:hypothetical protein